MLNVGKNKNRGFIKKILLVIVAIIALGFLVDFKSLTETERLRKNVAYLKTLSMPIWINYISAPSHYVWNKIVSKWAKTDTKDTNTPVETKTN